MKIPRKAAMVQPNPEHSVTYFKKRLLMVGEAVKRARQARGMTQNELSYLVGITAKTISAIEVGRVEPSVTQLQALAAGLNEPVGYFTGETVGSMEAKLDHVARELSEIRILMQKMKESETNERESLQA